MHLVGEDITPFEGNGNRLKGTVSQDFLLFFHESSSPKDYFPLGSFQIFLKIHGDIQGAPPVSTTLVANLPPVSTSRVANWPQMQIFNKQNKKNLN
jgi:hypothetical protein